MMKLLFKILLLIFSILIVILGEVKSSPIINFIENPWWQKSNVGYFEGDEFIPYELPVVDIQEIAPEKDYSSILGMLDYIFTGGISDGFQYDFNGNPIGYAPYSGLAPDVGMGGVNAVKGGIKAIQAGRYTITNTVANKLAKRPYINSPSTITNIMKSGKGVPDATFKGGMNYKVPGTFNGSNGIFELGINPQTNTIYHFLFKTIK